MTCCEKLYCADDYEGPMKLNPQCVPCMLKRCLFETDLVDPGKAFQVMKSSLAILNEGYSPENNSAELATKVHRKVYEILEEPDPYHDLKVQSNIVAKKLLPEARRMVEESDDPLKTSIIISITGNLLDFGAADNMPDPDGLAKIFKAVSSEGLAIDDTEKMKNLLDSSEKVLFLTDNAGEIFFDALLIEQIISRDCDVTVMVKGEPILNDALREDAESAKINALAKVIDTGIFAVGVDLKRSPENVKNAFEEADLIVAKGMANWESLSDDHPRPIAYILRAKCVPVADSIGTVKGTNVLKVFE